MRGHPLCGRPFYCSHFHPKEECVSNLVRIQISKCSFQTAIKCQIWSGMRWLPPSWSWNTCAHSGSGEKTVRPFTLKLKREQNSVVCHLRPADDCCPVLSFFVRPIYGRRTTPEPQNRGRACSSN